MSKDSRARSALARATCVLTALCLCLCAAGCGGGQETPSRPEVSARVERAIAAHEGTTWRVAFSPDGRLLASCSPDKTVKLWRVEDGGLAQTLTGGSEHVYAVAFSHEGRWLASGSREKGGLGTLWKEVTGGSPGGRGHSLRLWRVADGALQQSLDGHPGDVHSVAFSPDGLRFATSGEDKEIRLWTLEVPPH